MKVLKFLDNTIESIETWFIISSVILMVFLSFLQVILRNIFSTGIPGTDELLRHLVFWTGLVGASLLTKEGRHIKIDVLAKALPERLEGFRVLIVNLVSAGVSIILFRTSLTFMGIERDFGESATLFIFHIPIWILQIVMPIIFCMMSFRFLLKVLDRTLEYFK
jgi:TRAP-type C4-dicarboxylate transport system permease small subunit